MGKETTECGRSQSYAGDRETQKHGRMPEHVKCIRRMKDRFGSFARDLHSHKKTILLITITVAATLVVSSLVSIWLDSVSNLEFPSIGTIRFEGVEGYWDENLMNKTGPEAPYKWGLIWPGATRNLTIYLRSLSNVDTKFRHTETGWAFNNSKNEPVSPPINTTQYMYVSWDYDDSTVHPGETRRVTLTLHVESSSSFIDFLIQQNVRTFGFSMQISAEDVEAKLRHAHAAFE